MIKNKAIHAIIIGTCIFVNSMSGVYADTNAPDTAAAAQVQQVKFTDPLMEKQSEIDKYVFEDQAKDLAVKGITVTNTGIAGDYVEIGIAPFNKDSENYIYSIFGRDSVKVVQGIQAVTLGAANGADDLKIQVMTEKADDTKIQLTAAPSEEKASPIAAFFGNIIEWFKNIF